MCEWSTGLDVSGVVEWCSPTFGDFLQVANAKDQILHNPQFPDLSSKNNVDNLSLGKKVVHFKKRYDLRSNNLKQIVYQTTEQNPPPSTSKFHRTLTLSCHTPPTATQSSRWAGMWGTGRGTPAGSTSGSDHRFALLAARTPFAKSCRAPTVSAPFHSCFTPGQNKGFLAYMCLKEGQVRERGGGGQRGGQGAWASAGLVLILLSKFADFFS